MMIIMIYVYIHYITKTIKSMLKKLLGNKIFPNSQQKQSTSTQKSQQNAEDDRHTLTKVSSTYSSTSYNSSTGQNKSNNSKDSKNDNKSQEKNIMGSGLFSQYYSVKGFGSQIGNHYDVGDDDDQKDFKQLIHQFDALNISEIFPIQNKTNKYGNQESGSKNKQKDPAQSEQFLKIAKMISKQQQQSQKAKIFANLSQSETKSLILASYLNKILSDSLSNYLTQIPERYQDSPRIPRQQKQTLLLFLKEVVEQVDLDASKFSPKKYKYKIEEHVEQAIKFSKKVEAHLTVPKKQMLLKLTTAYMKQDYIHKQAKKILFRNLQTILSFYKQYKDRISPVSSKFYNTNPQRITRSYFNHKDGAVETNRINNKKNDFQLKQNGGLYLSSQMDQYSTPNNYIHNQNRKSKQKYTFYDHYQQQQLKRQQKQQVRSMGIYSENNCNINNNGHKNDRNSKKQGRVIVMNKNGRVWNQGSLQRQSRDKSISKNKSEKSLPPSSTQKHYIKVKDIQTQTQFQKPLKTKNKFVIKCQFSDKIDFHNNNKVRSNNNIYPNLYDSINDGSNLLSNLDSSNQQSKIQQKFFTGTKTNANTITNTNNIMKLGQPISKTITTNNLSLAQSSTLSKNINNSKTDTLFNISLTMNQSSLQHQQYSKISRELKQMPKNAGKITANLSTNIKQQQAKNQISVSNDDVQDEEESQSQSQSDSDSSNQDAQQSNTLLQMTKIIDNSMQNNKTTTNILKDKKQQSDQDDSSWKSHNQDQEINIQQHNRVEQKTIKTSQASSLLSFGAPPQKSPISQKYETLQSPQYHSSSPTPNPQQSLSYFPLHSPPTRTSPSPSLTTTIPYQKLPPSPPSIPSVTASTSVSNTSPYIKLTQYLTLNLTNILIKQFEQNFITYQNSKPSFHKQPRLIMLGFVGGLCKIVKDIRKCNNNIKSNNKDIANQVLNYLTDARVNNLLQIQQKYSNSGYFHQQAKLELFQYLQNIIKIKKQYN